MVVTTLLASSACRSCRSVRAFSSVVAPRPSYSRPNHVLRSTRMVQTRLWSTTEPATTLPEIETMRAGEIKRELESYGLDTKKYLEKSELVQALTQARADGLTSSESSNDNESTTTTTTAKESEEESAESRQERLQQEIANCQGLKAAELKQELQERGVSTAALFEKSELVQALAEARVNGVTQTKQDEDEEVVQKYDNVEVLTDQDAGPRTSKTTTQQPKQQQQQPGFGGPNPFPGGIPGMGSFGNMFGNMGGSRPGGGAGGPNAVGPNPFAGGFPGGEQAQQKAAEMAKNPKVMQIMMKAQSNPKVRAMLQDCMRNPQEGLNKYKDDPDMQELLGEMKQFF